MSRVFASIIFLVLTVALAASNMLHTFLKNNRQKWLLRHSTHSLTHSLTTSLFASTTSATSAKKLETIKPLTLNIYVEKHIRDHLNMRNSDRKAKLYLPQDVVVVEEGETQKQVTIKSLRAIIEHRFPPLYNQPYVVRYGVKGMNNDKPRQYSSDLDVMNSIQHSYHSSEPISIYVETSPGVWPPPSHDYLIGMNDPGESDTLTLLSFYKFYDIVNPDEVSAQLDQLWAPFKSTGRVYVAKEGINAQMAVPTNVLSNFEAACKSMNILQDIKLNTDHVMTRDDYYKAEPFRALHIRVRDQIVSDGFQEPLDWSKSGREMSPLEWHQSLDNPNTVVLDCRNSYESDVGIFDNAIPLNTTFFRESWDALDSILKDKDKDTQIMTYCTGGIRCVKINAYLEQKLGFKNVNRYSLTGLLTHLLTHWLTHSPTHSPTHSSTHSPNLTHSLTHLTLLTQVARRDYLVYT
jgi:predicted sulfurtransferase